MTWVTHVANSNLENISYGTLFSMSNKIRPILVTSAWVTILKSLTKTYGSLSKSTDKKKHNKNQEWPHVSWITINGTFIPSRFMSASNNTRHTYIQQQSNKYRKKTSFGTSRNTEKKESEKNKKKDNWKVFLNYMQTQI